MASEKDGGLNVLASFYDEGAFTPIFVGMASVASAAFGLVGGRAAYAVCQNGGALSVADVALCCKTLKLAAKTGNPVVTFYNSKGVKLTEGVKSLKAMAKLNAAAAKVSGVVPQISVVTGVCGASAALAAVGADLCIMAKDAELFLTPPSLSVDKAEGAGSAKVAAGSGVAAIVADDAVAAAREAAKLLMMLPSNNLTQASGFEFSMPNSKMNLAKYTGTSATQAVVDAGSEVELFNGFGDGVTTSLATIGGEVAGVVATNGTDTFIGRYCAAKIARFVRLCDSFSIPVVTILNSGGISLSSVSDAMGNIREAARLAGTYADATTAKIAIIAGKAIGALYTAMGNADLTIIMDTGVLAPAEPSAVVSVLYKDEIAQSGKPIEAETAARASKYAAEEAGANAVLAAGMADFTATADTLRTTLGVAMQALATKRTQRLPKKHGNMAL